jgi:IclR family transcriptional regulator, acetate operon repressor
VSVQSVERSFALVEALAGSDRPLGVSELCAASGLSLATVHRLLQTLVALGYVRRDGARGYALGPGFIRLGERAAAGLASWSRPLLEGLARELGESVNLAALDGDEVVYVAHVPSARSMRMFTEVGSRVAAHSTGVGKAMLAGLPEAEVRALAARTGLAPVTEHTVTDVDALLGRLDTVRSRGFALDEEEQELGVRCVAVAVPGEGPLLAVSVSGPTSRMSEEAVARAVPLLQEVAGAIAQETRRSA